MKIIVVGATGTVGTAIVNELSPRHKVVAVGHQTGDMQVDISDSQSIKKLYQSIGKFDAVIAATGNVHFGPLSEFTPEQYNIGLQSKLMGQVNLVLIGLHYINEGGSFTLTSGVLSHDPIRLGSSSSMVNGAIESFAKSAAIEMTNNVRINVVSPTVLTESLDKYGPYFRGFESAPASRVARAYSKSVEGGQTGQIYNVE
jgi:NAD(P)-dependent dehydrogenase (short-subunit alcohol dehydrogenase family)